MKGKITEWLKTRDWFFTLVTVVYTVFVWRVESPFSIALILVIFWILVWLTNRIRKG